MLAWGLAAPTATTARAAPEPPATSTAATSTAATSTSVTLVTGDRVRFDGREVVSITPAPGRENTPFRTFHRAGRLHVVPLDAAAPLAAGRLDLRLFDVTGLAEAGYDDARRDTVPLIVSGVRPAAPALWVTGDLPAATFTAQVAKSGAATAFRSLVDDPGVTKVWLDGLRRTGLDHSTARIGAPTAWAAGHTGAGVVVAVLDTGVDDTHPDLAGQVAGRADFTEQAGSADPVGHGTHVAATIASTHPRYRGVAPGARILDGKVCTLRGCAESAVLRGAQWAVDQGADVVNLSLGGPDTPDVDPLEAAVDRLSAETGALFVVAAGNSGGPGTVSSPSTADAALSVGAVDRADAIAEFSSRGPRPGDRGVKPDLTAPGVGIVAARSRDGVIGTPVDDAHVALSGTSMATPHAAGAAALLAEQHPDWTGAQLKAALVASARHNPAATAFEQGAGRVDAARAITTDVTADPVSLALGVQFWPHDDDTPVARTHTYRNTGPNPVTLDLAVEATGPDGGTAPAGLFSVHPTRITVPPGGTAQATVTGDTRGVPTHGTYTGAVVASNGLRTPLSIEHEPERYEVTTRYTDDRGAPTDAASSVLSGIDEDFFAFLPPVGGVAKTRLPPGDYVLENVVVTDGERLAVLPQPLLRVTGDTTVEVDARRAEPVAVTPPEPGAEEVFGQIVLHRRLRDRWADFGIMLPGGFRAAVSLAPLGPTPPRDELTTIIGAQSRGAPVRDTPVNYRLVYVERGEVPTGFTRAPGKRQLAEVTQRAAPGGPDVRYPYIGVPLVVGGGSGAGSGTQFGPNGESIDYVTTQDVAWRWMVDQVNGTRYVGNQVHPWRTYHAGRDYRHRYFRPVLGPAFSPVGSPASRTGDRVDVSTALWGDRDGNLGVYSFASSRLTLHRNGVQVGESDYPGNGQFTVPPGPADFRLAAEVTAEPGATELSTEVSAAWTFRSGTAEATTPLPLTVVRFRPDLDESGGAPAHRLLRVPLEVRRLGDAEVRRLTAEVSFDDGATWSRVPVAGRAALIRNGAEGFASLRVEGADRDGNSFRQTVIRAYRVTG
ncbi:S8 family serine peptidase [Saccharothrix xinjiangensis]|uniref:S8 family serine peptidase n=1 Tax=Saccharothrix xinjiangensis TaxID=204798 RepID=A0ABV9Y2C0_9PSEU